MSDPVFPDDNCVRTLRSTVATLLRERPTPQQLGESIIEALKAMEKEAERENWIEVASYAGTLASCALVLMLDAMSRLPPKSRN